MVKVIIKKFESKKQREQAISEVARIPLKKKCTNCFYCNQTGNFSWECVKYNMIIPNDTLKLEEDEHPCGMFEEDDFPG